VLKYARPLTPVMYLKRWEKQGDKIGADRWNIFKTLHQQTYRVRPKCKTRDAAKIILCPIWVLSCQISKENRKRNMFGSFAAHSLLWREVWGALNFTKYRNMKRPCRRDVWRQVAGKKLKRRSFTNLCITPSLILFVNSRRRGGWEGIYEHLSWMFHSYECE